jgi:hypothetical protein
VSFVVDCDCCSDPAVCPLVGFSLDCYPYCFGVQEGYGRVGSCSNSSYQITKKTIVAMIITL